MTKRSRRRHFALLALCTSCSLGIATGSSEPFPAVRLAGAPPRYELRNGYWFNGRTFEPMTRYSVYGALSDRQPVPVHSVIDLQGGYVVPAFGEAHNHNAVATDTGVSNRYLQRGHLLREEPQQCSARSQRGEGEVPRALRESARRFRERQALWPALQERRVAALAERLNTGPNRPPYPMAHPGGISAF